MRMICCGGIGEEGRSCLVLDAGDAFPLMVDCGVKREFSPGRPGRYPELPDCLPDTFPLLLTHAHEDHTASIPWLVARGFRPEVHATRRTIDLAPGYCRTWLKAVDKAVRATGGDFPYGEEHIESVDWRILPEGELHLGPWTVRHGQAAHMPGSCWYHIAHRDRPGESVCVSGDWSAGSTVYPPPGFPPCRIFITDASGRDGDGEGAARLAALVESGHGRPLFLPLPKLGRCQEMLSLMASMPALADRPEAVAMEAALVDALDVWLADEAVTGDGRKALERARTLFAEGRWLRFSSPEELEGRRPAVIGAMDAMLSAGISGELAERTLAQGGTVAFSGHAAAGTPGRQMLDEGRPGVMRLPWQIHPGPSDVEKAIERLRPAHTVLVHAPAERAVPLARELGARTGLMVHAPAVGDVLELH